MNEIEKLQKEKEYFEKFALELYDIIHDYGHIEMKLLANSVYDEMKQLKKNG